MGGYFDFDEKSKEVDSLVAEMQSDGFWQDIENANKVNQRVNTLKKELETYNDLKKRIDDTLLFLDALNNDEEVSIIEDEISSIRSLVDELETSVILSDEFDSSNCYIEIHPGAGGTESCDWASMLLRMYEKYAANKGYTLEVIDEAAGEEAGIKNVTIKLSGENAYGMLKFENGVHRLVRISPFDAGRRRHTSFASVIVTPEITRNIDVEIKEADLKIDVYHSSGAGGQSVNTSNSAVRITHLPSKIVVTCQNERSQLKNKEQALKMLKNKLYLQKLEEQERKENSLKDTSSSVEFGSQIRSYILEPYKLVKDHRTNFESTDPDKILDGDLEKMLIFNLKSLVNKKHI